MRGRSIWAFTWTWTWTWTRLVGSIEEWTGEARPTWTYHHLYLQPRTSTPCVWCVSVPLFLFFIQRDFVLGNSLQIKNYSSHGTSKDLEFPASLKTSGSDLKPLLFKSHHCTWYRPITLDDLLLIKVCSAHLPHFTSHHFTLLYFTSHHFTSLHLTSPRIVPP